MFFLNKAPNPWLYIAIFEIPNPSKVNWGLMSHEKKNLLSVKYWLFNRHPGIPYNGKL